ncbi:MAG: hypothetical protein AAF108_09290 [Planctomycetota bacterium]
MFTALSLWIAAGVMRPTAAQIPEDDTARAFAARLVAQTGLVDLRLNTDPQPGDYLIASELFRIAGELDPGNPRLLRRRIETLRLAGDNEGLIEVTRQLLRVDPQDTVAQLRLIGWEVNRLQTVAERLDAYRRLVESEAASRLDPSVRSRLALDAALLAQEAGLAAEADRLLRLSTSLDRSNKDAAAMAYTRFGPSLDEVARFRLLLALVRADPLDPNAVSAVADRLVAAGAFGEAQRFYNISDALLARSGVQAAPQALERRLALLWWNKGPEAVLDALELQLLQAREAAERQLRQLEELGESTADATRPEDVRLDAAFESFRALSALSLSRRAPARAALDDLQASINETNRTISERASTGELSREQLVGLQELASAYVSRLVATRLIAGEGVRSAKIMLQQLRQSTSIPPLEIAALDGMLLLRSGQAGAAIDALEPIAEREQIIGVALGLSYAELGIDAKAADAFERAARQRPLSPLGVYAAEQYARIVGRSIEFSSARQELVSAAREMLPAWYDDLVRDPFSFMRLDVSPQDSSISGLDENLLRVTLRNTAPIPLAVGVGRPIGTRLLFSPLVEVDAETFRDRLRPEVVDVTSRLRLAPREELSMVVAPTPGVEGLILEINCGRRVRARWRVLQSFVLAEGGQYQPGVLSLTARTDTVVRGPVLLARRPDEALAGELEIAENEQLARALAVLRARFAGGPRDRSTLTEEQRRAIIDAVTVRLPVYGKAMKLIAAACVPPSSREPAGQAFEDAVWADADADTKMVMLITRATSPDDPEFVLALNSSDERLRWFAELLRDRLERTSDGFARFIGPAAR